jgi:hypothetical protein
MRTPSTGSTASVSKFSDKEGAFTVEEKEVSSTVYNPEVDVSGVDERKLLRKVDLYLIPWLSFIYLLSFLDRTSIGK